MQKVALGSSSLQVSRLGYGCWRIAGKVENAELTPDREAEAQKAILTAYELGFTLFDHADIYSDGVAEAIFGRVLRQNPSMREKILLATKCGIRREGDPIASAPYRYDFSQEHIIASCEGSLKRLQTDVIDIYQLHRPDYLARPEEVAGAFSKLRDQGKVREFGLSNALPSFFSMMQKYCPMRLIVNQVEISLMRLEPFHNGTLEHCMTEGVTPLAWSPLAAGRLAFHGPIDLNEQGHAKRIMLRDAVDAVARERGVSRGIIALAWLLKHPAGIVPLVGSTDGRNIRDLVKAADLNLTREEWYSLMEGAQGQRLP